MSHAPVVGILLAAGSASRFGADKLAATLPDGTPVGVAALRNLARRGGFGHRRSARRR